MPLDIPNIRSTDSHSSSPCDQLSASKNQGVNAILRIRGLRSEAKQPKTSRTASCSQQNRNGDILSLGQCCSSAAGPPRCSTNSTIEFKSSCQDSSAARPYIDQQESQYIELTLATVHDNRAAMIYSISLLSNRFIGV
jgi:hypothetical protein